MLCTRLPSISWWCHLSFVLFPRPPSLLYHWQYISFNLTFHMFVACLVVAVVLLLLSQKSAHRYRMNVGISSIQNEIDNVLLLHVLIRIGVLLWLLLSATIWFYKTHTHTHARITTSVYFSQAISSFRYPVPNRSSWFCISTFLLFSPPLFIHLFTFHGYFSSFSILFIRFHLFRLRITSTNA